MSRYDASFEEGWGVPAEQPAPAARTDTVESRDVLPAQRFRRASVRREETAESRPRYLPWYEWRRQGLTGRPLFAPASDEPATAEDSGSS